MVSRPIAGQAGLFRVTTMAASLQELEDNRQDAVAKLANAGVLDLLSQSPMRGVGKVVHRVQA